MIAVDTNVLVYAHVDAFPKHEAARRALEGLSARAAPWGIPAPCVVEFLRVVTHPRVLAEPFTIDEAIDAIETLLAVPSATVLCPSGQHWPFLSEAAREADARGNLAFDAAIAAVCREVGVTRLLTEDGDFDRFAGLPVARLRDG